jgi:hypothetical protein
VTFKEDIWRYCLTRPESPVSGTLIMGKMFDNLNRFLQSLENQYKNGKDGLQGHPIRESADSHRVRETSALATY